MQDLIALAAPHILEIIGLMLAAFLARVANTARKKWGIDIEAKHLNALQSALMTGARLALSRNLTGAEARAVILGHVQLSVPDAVIGLRAGHEVLTNLAQATLSKAASEAAGAAQDASKAISATVGREVAKAIPSAVQVALAQAGEIAARRR